MICTIATHVKHLLWLGWDHVEWKAPQIPERSAAHCLLRPTLSVGYGTRRRPVIWFRRFSLAAAAPSRSRRRRHHRPPAPQVAQVVVLLTIQMDGKIVP